MTDKVSVKVNTQPKNKAMTKEDAPQRSRRHRRGMRHAHARKARQSGRRHGRQGSKKPLSHPAPRHRMRIRSTQPTRYAVTTAAYFTNKAMQNYKKKSYRIKKTVFYVNFGYQSPVWYGTGSAYQRYINDISTIFRRL